MISPIATSSTTDTVRESELSKILAACYSLARTRAIDTKVQTKGEHLKNPKSNTPPCQEVDNNTKV